MRRCIPAILICGWLLGCSAIWAGDWPQFLGPERTGISTETGLLAEWPAGGLKEVWRVSGGVGMSGIAISRGRAVTMVQREGQQRMVALDVKTGRTLWDALLAPAYTNQMGDGPRSTPTIAGERVFALTGEGILAAVSFVDGEVLWSVPALKELRGQEADYGMACSPLVVKEHVIVNLGAPNAAVAAFDIATGKLAWSADNDPAGYSSPALLNVGGKQQVVAFTGGSVLGVSPDRGDVLWRFPYETDFGCNIAAPLAYKNQVFISAGENHGSALLALKDQGGKLAAEEVWASLGTKSVLRNEWQTSILVDDHLYGFDNVGGAGPVSHLACIEAATGKPVWQQPRFGKGNAIWAEGKLFIVLLNGELAIARVSPQGYHELGRGPVVGKTRQAPALANGLLFLRDDQNIVCLDVRKP
jgi:outer membrane protein assembly factor BamB